MNWADLLAPRYFLAHRPDGMPLQTRLDSWEQQLLGFDRQTSRFVSIHTLLPRSALPPEVSRSVGERVYLAGRISHPGLFNVTDYGERAECLYYVTEWEEGEVLPAYLARLHSLPLPFAIDLAIQLVALLRYLAHFPRILQNLTPGDLMVAPSSGQLLCVRFAGLGLNRPEPGIEPAIPEPWWPALAASLLWDLVGASIRNDHQLKFSPLGSSVLLDPFRHFLHLAGTPSHRSSSDALRDLEIGFHRHLDRFFKILDPHRWPCPEECVSLRPKSFLSRHLLDDGILPDWQDHNYEFAPELFYGHSRYALAARNVRTGADVAFQVLPPDSLLGDTGLESLYRKLGDPALKEESGLLRTFFLRSEATYTFFAEEAVHGFNLVELTQRRGALCSDEVSRILNALDPVFQHLDSVAGLEDLTAPWNIYFDFGAATTGDELSQCLSSKRLHEWPSYRVRMRVGPTLVDFTRPVRSEWAEIVHLLSLLGGEPAPAYHHLDLSFAALAVFMLEFQRYRSLLVGADPRPRAPVSCAKFQNLLSSTLLSGAPHTASLREHFLQSLERQLGSLAYPCNNIHSPVAEEPTSPVSGKGLLQPSGLDSAPDATSQSVRQRRVTLLRRLLRRESSRQRMKQAKPVS